MAIYASNFFTRPRGTNVRVVGMDIDNLSALLAACEEEVGVGSEFSSMAGSVSWTRSTLFVKFSLSVGTSIRNLCGVHPHKPHP